MNRSRLEEVEKELATANAEMDAYDKQRRELSGERVEYQEKYEKALLALYEHREKWNSMYSRQKDLKNELEYLKNAIEKATKEYEGMMAYRDKL